MSTQPEPEFIEEDTKKEASRRQIAMIVGVAVLLLVLFWFLFLRGGGEDAPTDQTLPAPPAPTVTDIPGPEGDGEGGKGDKPGDGPVETTEVFASRDPFKPLLTTGGSGETTDDTGEITDTTDTGDASTDTDDTGTIEDPGGTTDDPDPDGDGNGSDGDQNVEGHTVQLIGINGSGDDATAQIQVDDTIYTVQEGETFADNFELLSTSGECATVLFGDDQFTVCEGEEILK